MRRFKAALLLAMFITWLASLVAFLVTRSPVFDLVAFVMMCITGVILMVRKDLA